MNIIKKWQIAAFASFLMLCAIPLSAQTKLSFNPKVGAKYEYKQDVVQTISQSAMGQEMQMEQNIITDYLMLVKSKEKQTFNTQMTYQSMGYMMSTPMMKISYDSKNPATNPSDVDALMAKIFDCLINKNINVLINSNGAVESVSGMEAIVDAMGQSAGVSGAQAVNSMKQQFNDESMKSTFEQSFNIYSDVAVKIGDSWNKSYTNVTMGMNMKTDTKYTLKGIEKNTAIIAVESIITILLNGETQADLSGDQTGTMQVDIKSGMPLQGDISQNLKGNITANGMEVSMNIISKSKTSTKVL